MRRLYVATVLLVIWCGAASAHPSCKSLESISVLQSRVATANEASFAKALAAAKLAPVGLDRVEWDADDDELSPARTTVTRRIDGELATVLVVDSTDLTCAGLALRKRDKRLYLVERRPHEVRSPRMSACGCPPRPPPRCASAGESHRVGYVVPPGLTYVGLKSIEYPVEILYVVWGADSALGCRDSAD